MRILHSLSSRYSEQRSVCYNSSELSISCVCIDAGNRNASNGSDPAQRRNTSNGFCSSGKSQRQFIVQGGNGVHLTKTGSQYSSTLEI